MYAAFARRRSVFDAPSITRARRSNCPAITYSQPQEKYGDPIAITALIFLYLRCSVLPFGGLWMI